MIYLKEFILGGEADIIRNMRNIYTSHYPLGIFSEMGLSYLEFEPITIFYGSNGVGKTTLLNMIAMKLQASRRNINKQSDLFEKFVDGCSCTMINQDELQEIKSLSSDDIFDYLLDVRAINSEVNRRKETIGNEYLRVRENKEGLQFDSRVEGSYEELVKRVDSRRMTQSKYIRSRLANNNMVQHSNGESALEFWQNEIREYSLYLLDEPENSLSPESQIRLKQFIEESARFYGCQFIISTHSPFLLALEDARIYDLDKGGEISRWQDLENVRTYYYFFKDKSGKFE